MSGIVLGRHLFLVPPPENEGRGEFGPEPLELFPPPLPPCCILLYHLLLHETNTLLQGQGGKLGGY